MDKNNLMNTNNLNVFNMELWRLENNLFSEEWNAYANIAKKRAAILSIMYLLFGFVCGFGLRFFYELIMSWS